MVGAGSFGTVVANLIASNGNPTFLAMRDEAQLQSMRRGSENLRYLPGLKLSEHITFTSDFRHAVANSSMVFVVVPSGSFREVAREIAPHVRPGTGVVSGTKGLESTGFRLMSQIIEEEIAGARKGVLSGPNLAEEIAAGKFAGTVIASEEEDLCLAVQNALATGTFRVYANSDVYGVELGGALKNIYAIICGIAMALNVGQNAIATVITRSLAEMSRFAVSMGASPYTFLGLSGVGDLVATCTSPHSRNYQLGYRIGRGLSLSEAMNDLGRLAEGVNTLRVVCRKRDELNVYMPLARGLEQVLFEDADMGEVVIDLMTSEHQPDVDFAEPVNWSRNR